MIVSMRSLNLVILLDGRHVVPVPLTTLLGIAIMQILAVLNLPVLRLPVPFPQFLHGTKGQAVLITKHPTAFLTLSAAVLVISGMGQPLQ